MVRKDKDLILSEMLEDMKKNTPITQTTAGGVARSLLEIFNERLDDTYNYIDDRLNSVFISTASGSDLNKIGELLNCTRLTGESDNNYRYRITQQVHVAAKSNRDALIAKCLEVEGVVDIILTPYTHGVGSFTAHVISNELDTPDPLVNQIQAVLDANKAEGIRAIAAKPQLVPVDISIRIILSSGVSSQEASSISYDVKTETDSYIKSLGMGTPINSMEIYRIANRSKVVESSIESVKISGRTISGSMTEYVCKWNQRFYPREINVII